MEKTMGKKTLALTAALALSVSMLATGCSSEPKTPSTNEDGNTPAPVSNESVTGGWRTESYVNGIIYQESAEVAGLQYQAYQLAKIRLDERIAERDAGKYDKPIAIVSDIDDTLASDCNYMAGVVLDDPTWDNTHWDGYYHALASTSNTAIPGAVEFCKYAESKGVEWIVLPNATYGDYCGAAWNNDKELDAAGRAACC